MLRQVQHLEMWTAILCSTVLRTIGSVSRMDVKACEQKPTRPSMGLDFQSADPGCTCGYDQLIRTKCERLMHKCGGNIRCEANITTVYSRQCTRSCMSYHVFGMSNRHTYVEGRNLEDGLDTKRATTLQYRIYSSI